MPVVCAAELVSCNNRNTVDEDDIVQSLGRLSLLMQRLDAALKAALQLP